MIINGKELKNLEKELLEELSQIAQHKKNLELQLEIIRSFKVNSYLPKEGDTISYKLGKVLLETNIWNLYKLPMRLLAIRKYAKYKKFVSLPKTNIKEIKNNITEVDNIVENKNRGNNIDSFTKIDKEKKKGLVSSIPSMLVITSESQLLAYNKAFPSYHLMEDNITQLTSTKSSVLLVDSVWSGIKDHWKYALLSEGMKSIQGEKLKNAIYKLKEKNIPLAFIFRDKIDFYERYKSIIELSDIVLSSNPSVLKRISSDFNNKLIGTIPKTASLSLFNPSDPCAFYEKKNVVYLGEYDKEFNDDNLELLSDFQNLSKDELVLLHHKDAHNSIYDNNPSRWDSIEKNINKIELVKLLKTFKFTLYIANKDETDIPQKIVDSLACGIPVISTKCEFLEENLKDVVLFINKPEDILEINKKYRNRWEYSRLSHRCYRFIANNYSTYRLRVSLEKELVGRDIKQDNYPLVSIIMASMREHYIDRIVKNISRQNYKNKELIIVTQNFSEEGLKELENKLSKVDNLIRFQIVVNNSNATLGERQNQAASHAKGSLLAKFDDDDFYFENYLADMVIPFQFGNYDMVGKAEVFFYLEALDKTVLVRDGRAAYRNMDFVSGATFVIKKSVFDKLGGFINLNQSEDSNLLKRLKESGGKIYSADPFNFVVFRSKNVENHTWKQQAEDFLKSSSYIGNGLSEDITVI